MPMPSAVIMGSRIDVWRARKGMVLDPADHDTWSVGSFFTNPVVAPEFYRELADSVSGTGRAVPHYPAPGGVKLAAGWLVEHAGFGKGYPDVPTARSRLSTKHALALTNRGEASADDVISLARTLSFNGLANGFRVAAINGGSHVAPTFGGDTIYAWSEVLEKAVLPGRDDIGALRVRTIAAKDCPCDSWPGKGADGKYHPAVVLDLDYWLLMPRR